MGNAPRHIIPVEQRAGVELRASTDGKRLEGYAARFGVAARIGDFFETIKAGAFAASLAGTDDQLALVDHDPGRLLARRSSGTLRLVEDASGLHFSLDVPATTLGRDVLELARRHDLGGMSFGFRAVDDVWLAHDRRELRAVQLIEVSIVHAFPAYTGTTVIERARNIRWGTEDARAARRRRQTLDLL